jgi:hypothetical protein
MIEEQRDMAAASDTQRTSGVLLTSTVQRM